MTAAREDDQEIKTACIEEKPAIVLLLVKDTYPGKTLAESGAQESRTLRAQRRKQEEIERLGLGPYVLELELNGYTVVPPEVTGVTEAQVDELSDLLLKKSEELVGCEFTVEGGAAEELDFGNYPGTLELISRSRTSWFSSSRGSGMKTWTGPWPAGMPSESSRKGSAIPSLRWPGCAPEPPGSHSAPP